MGQVNAFSVDLEDWFQGLTSTNPQVEEWSSFESRVIPATQTLLDVLRVHNVQATFFVLGHVADQHPTLIEDIQAEGHELSVHGYFHRFVDRLTPDDFARDLERSIQAVERITGEMPLGHRAPYFSVNRGTPWVFDILQAQGLRYDSSLFPTRTMLYGFPEAPRFPHRLNDHHHLAGDDVPGQRGAGDDAERAERDTDGNTDCDGNAQPQRGDGTAGDFLRLECHGDQRRLGYRGCETDQCCEDIDPDEIGPDHNPALECPADKFRRRQLLRHGAANGKQRYIEADQK